MDGALRSPSSGSWILDCGFRPPACYSEGLPIPPEPPQKAAIDEPPPFLGSWRNVYIFVLCYLAVVILGFYLFSRAYAP